MIAPTETLAGTRRASAPPTLASIEAAIAEIVRLKILRAGTRAGLDARIAQIETEHAGAFATWDREILALENEVREYCVAQRRVLFPGKKSRRTRLAEFGFEFTGWRVVATRKVTAADTISRLLRTAWGRPYVRVPVKKTLDKEALLKDREKLTPARLAAAGLEFVNEEQFYIRPRPVSAAEPSK